jgi:hypothetical protein
MWKLSCQMFCFQIFPVSRCPLFYNLNNISIELDKWTRIWFKFINFKSKKNSLTGHLLMLLHNVFIVVAIQSTSDIRTPDNRRMPIYRHIWVRILNTTTILFLCIRLPDRISNICPDTKLDCFAIKNIFYDSFLFKMV